MSQLRDDLIAARERISAPTNWCKKRYTNDAGQHCSIGAVYAVVGWDDRDRVEACRVALGSQVPGHSESTPALFNDLDSTTHSDIIALFDRAIEAAE